MSDWNGRRWHDMGGQAAGPVPMEGHDFALWEKRVDALMVVCGKKGLFTVDGLRRALEDMGEDAFERYSYYERWIAAVNQNLIEAGVYSLEELATRMNEIAARGPTYAEAQRNG
ncbi:Nitrile hydratase beta subunit [Roseovarius azorensis]|uniref:Nitrile hydratase beta subunit n=1 Tax=Roseovarius azorensis TaxID=1287727 RepID=A0A1H7FMZ6_9RHOB|nr:SH3-like domain-containing protein [Roseovarius azorensis]SEK25822.1 Nitrile hydratase beta subunit [Roseovarius azorensis]